MPKDYNQIRKEYLDFKTAVPDTTLDLTEFAKQSDIIDGTPERQAAYEDGVIKQLNATIDRGFDATGVNDAGEYIVGGLGKASDDIFGTNIEPTMNALGRGLPRMVVESVLTAPEAASGVGAPVAVATWAKNLNNLRKIVGYGSAATRGVADTDSLAGGLVSAGSLGLANKFIPQTGKAVTTSLNKFLERGTAPLGDIATGALPEATSPLQRVLVPTAALAGEAGTATAINEGTRQAMMSVGPNAVAWNDAQRNPLTEENIASNVAGSLAFAPQLVEGLRNPMRLKATHIEQLDAQTKARAAAEKAAIDTHMIVDPTEPVVQVAPELADRQAAVHAIFKSALDNARDAREKGDFAGEEWNHERASSALREMISGRYSPYPPEVMENVKELTQKTAREAVMSPEHFEQFRKETLATIDAYREQYSAYQDELALREESLNLNDKKQVAAHEAWKARMEAQRGETWHPTAASDVLVEDLWKNGKLKPLTPEWVDAEIQDAISKGDSPEKARGMAQQKIANYLSDAIPDAVAARNAEAKAVTEYSPNVQKINDREREFLRALSELPREIQDGLVARTKTIRNSERVDPRSGRTMDKSKNWEDTVIQAAKTFDPAARTIEYNGQKIPYMDLVRKNPETGKFVQPFETPLEKGAGGGGQKKGVGVVDSIQAMEETQKRSKGLNSLDEEQFKQYLAETQSGEGLLGSVRDPAQGVVEDTSAVLGEDTLGKAVESTAPVESTTDKVLTKKEQALRNIKELSDDQLWALARDKFNFRNSVQAEAKKGRLREMLNGVLNNTGKWTDEQRSFFQNDSRLPDGKSTREHHVERLQQIMGRLTDDLAVSKVKRGLQPKAAGVLDENTKNTFANTSPEGDFNKDVLGTMRSAIRSQLGRQGYSGQSLDFLTEVAAALVKNGPGGAVDFYRLAGNNAGLAGVYDAQGKFATGPAQEGMRGKLGLNVSLERPNPAKAALALLQTLQHEIVHMDQFIREGLLVAPDAYSQNRQRILDNMHRLGDKLTPDERESMLKQVLQYLPKELQSPRFEPDTGRVYGTNNVDEFVAEMTAHATKMLLFDTEKGRATAKEMLDYAPTEFKELARDTFRTMADIMEAMTEKTYRGIDQTKFTDPWVTDQGFQAMLESAKSFSELRYPDQAIASGREMVANLKAPTVGMTDAMWFRKAETPFKETETMPAQSSQTAIDAVKQAIEHIGPRAADKLNRGNYVERFLMPFRNKMWAMERDGNTMARPIADKVFGIEGDTNRVHSFIVDGFLKKNADGSVNYDAAHPLIERIQKEPTGRWRDEGINRISAWQQSEHDVGGGVKKEAQSMFVEDPKTGQIIVNPGVKDAQAAWDRIRHGFNPEDQQFLMNMSVAMDKMGQKARDLTLAQILRSHENAITAAVMGANRQMSMTDAQQIARQVHGGFINGQPQSVMGVLPPEQMATLAPMIDGLMKIYTEVQTNLMDRPGHRSESLPHDWIIRYRNAAGETKFTSSTTEKNAKIVASRLAAQGNTIDGEIVNRREVNTFRKTDDPDNVLTRASEKEAFVWAEALKEIEKVHGTQVMQDVQSAYNPLSEARVSAAEKIAGPVLKKRKDYVDRAEFDYIDAAMASAGRLARSIALRTAKQEIGLMLNDPAVRLQPSFRAMVEEHLAEMSKPQSEWSKTAKSVVSGMYLGANLGSAIANATQSLSTLVPILDTMEKGGSFATPWKRLTKAVGKMVDMTMSDAWKQDAAVAATKDPSLWTKEEQTAALWKKQVENGGFSHTVVDDLIVGSDQKRLALAKFGRGDYGPVTKASLLGSGMYALNQFAMKPFRWVEHGNAKAAFLAGVEQAYDQGLRGDAAFSHANQVQGLATFGGGRANASGLQTSLSKGFSPGGAGLALALQQYGFGVVAMHAQFVKDSISGSKTLSPAEKMRMRRVYGTMLMTQTALAGALGLPLVGATLTVLEKVFGIPANQAVRDGLAHLHTDENGDPDETGQAIAEIGLNGFANWWTGIDVASRLGTSSLLGTSSYRGFNWGDLMGPTAGILENGVKSLGYFASGEPLKAAHELAPQALKNALQLQDNRTKYGDAGFRDKAGNLLYTPTPAEETRYVLGMRPAGLSRKRQAEAAMRFANDTALAAADRELDAAAQGLLKGDPSTATLLARNRVASDPTADPHEVLRTVMNRAVGMSMEKDLMATGAQISEEERSRIAKTFGEGVVNRRSEMELQQLRSQFAAMLGDSRLQPSPAAFQQAMLVDMLVKQKGMPRSQALRMVRFLEHGPVM